MGGETHRSKQGELLKQIQDTDFAEIPWSTFVEYAGYKRGIETFIKIVLRENEKLRDVVIPNPKQPWGSEPEYSTTSLEGLMYVIGSMRTSRSFEALMTFAKGDFHPYIHCEAVWGLTHDYDRKRQVWNLAKQLLRSPRHTLDIYGGLLVLDHWSWRFRAETIICEAVPFLDHDYFMARIMAGSALASNQKGRDFLAKYQRQVRERNMSDLDELFLTRIDEMVAWRENFERRCQGQSDESNEPSN